MNEERRPASATDIVAAAERLADDIKRRAESDAAVIRERAAGDSDQRRKALREQVTLLTGLAQETLARVQELSAQLEVLRGDLGDLPDGDASLETHPAAESAPAEPAAAERSGAGAGGAGSTAATDEVGARLVALNLAISDTPREEIARQLREQHSIADPDKLLDDVYSSIGR